MKLFKKILVALVSAALLSAPFAASALTLDNVESSEEYVPTVVGDDGLTDTEWLKQQASEIYSDDYMAAFEEMAAMELTASNLRYVIDVFGMTESFGRDYAIDENLLGYFPNYTMEDIVWNLAAIADTSLMDMNTDNDLDSAAGIAANKKKIVVSASNEDIPGFKVTYNGTTNDTNSFQYDAAADLVIEPLPGYKISSVTMLQGSFYGLRFEDITDLCKVSGQLGEGVTLWSGDSITIPAEYFNGMSGVYLDESDPDYGKLTVGVYPLTTKKDKPVALQYNYAEFKVTTAPLPAGEFDIIENGDTSALYSVSGVNGGSNVNAASLKAAINTAIQNKYLQVGNTLIFTFDTSKIDSVVVDGTTLNIESGVNHFDVEVKDKPTTIEFVYKAKASFDMSDGNSGATYRVETRRAGADGFSTVVTAGNVNKVIEALNNKYNAGDEVTITITVPAGKKLESVTYNGDQQIEGNSVSFRLVDGAQLSVVISEIKPIVAIAEYNKNVPGATDYDKFVVACIENHGELTDTKIKNAYFMVTNAKLGGNPNEDDYLDGRVDAGRTGAYFAMGFTPKMEDGYHFKSSFDVTAYVEYDSQPAGNSKTITVTLG